MSSLNDLIPKFMNLLCGSLEQAKIEQVSIRNFPKHSKQSTKQPDYPLILDYFKKKYS